MAAYAIISIHAPREGRDRVRFGHRCQSWISIHAPLAGRDSSTTVLPSTSMNFNPRAPRGARPVSLKASQPRSLFQSTRPSRGATSPAASAGSSGSHFNPRAPRGARHKTLVNGTIYSVFQSTRPSRGATGDVFAEMLEEEKFQSTRPSRGATCMEFPSASVSKISIHAPLAGRDPTR